MCVPNVSQLPGGCWPVGYLQSVEELSLGLPKTNPVSGREEDLNLGPPDYKSSALTTRPLPYLSFAITSTIGFPERSTVRMKWCINASHFKWSWIAGACPMYVTTLTRRCRRHAFSPPEPTILLVSNEDRNLLPAPTPEVRDPRTQCQIRHIWLA